VKLPANLQRTGYHQYCIGCFAETVQRVTQDGKTYYHCQTCRKTLARSLVLDPTIKSWIDDDGEYCHESSGVFIRRSDRRILFFQRTIFPFSLTVPSGHVDDKEDPNNAACREVYEEVGLHTSPDELYTLSSDVVNGDSCRRGADRHLWHAYKIDLSSMPDIFVKEEGRDPVWLSVAQALSKKLTVPVRYYLERFSDELSR
jgi:8-oxo-dGTP pyrophosphatase MutT (NUDIX family)